MHLTCVQIAEESNGHTEDRHENVRHRQVYDEVVGDIVHGAVPDNHGDHHQVPEQGEEEHRRVYNGVDNYHIYRLF